MKVGIYFLIVFLGISANAQSNGVAIQESVCSASYSTETESYVVEINGRAVSSTPEIVVIIQFLRSLGANNVCTRFSGPFDQVACEGVACGTHGASCVSPCSCNAGNCQL